MNYNFFWILLIRRLIDDVSEENLCNDDAKVQIVQTTPKINFCLVHQVFAYGEEKEICILACHPNNDAYLKVIIILERLSYFANTLIRIKASNILYDNHLFQI